jgi:hypothetical protein
VGSYNGTLSLAAIGAGGASGAEDLDDTVQKAQVAADWLLSIGGAGGAGAGFERVGVHDWSGHGGHGDGEDREDGCSLHVGDVAEVMSVVIGVLEVV